MKLGSLFKSLAPTIASAAGSPLAGMALSIVTKTLNLPKNTTANEIEDLIEREPEKATLLKQADLEFQTRIKEMEIDLESFRLETVDRKDARYHFSQDWTPKVFSILCLILYGGYVLTVTLVPTGSETIVSLVLGQLSALLGTAAAFFYGSHNNGNGK